jgi:LuxR family maltose regulon positive regulatory protein
MAEIRSDDLRFTESEAGMFLNDAIGLALSPEQVSALASRTEGWITGLQLAAISMQGKRDSGEFISAFSGSHHYIVDYLIDEVLSLQPQPIQTFLLQTSILDRFNASLCDAVVKASNSRQVLERLTAANLFLIPLDDERGWYRYHHLFAEFLTHRLRERDVESLPELHRRASAWLEQHNLTTEAINHAIAGKDFPRAAQLVESIGPGMMMQSEFDQLTTWLDAIPQDIVLDWPWLCIIRAWMCQRWARLDQGERYLQAAEQALANPSISEPVGGERVIRGQVAAIRALFCLATAQIPQSMEYASQALEYLPADHFNRAVAADALGIAKRVVGDFDDAITILGTARHESLDVGNRILAQAIMLELGKVQALQGRLSQAAGTFREAIDLEYHATQLKIPYASAASVQLARILQEWGDLDSAISHLDEGIRIGEPAKMVDAVVSGHAGLARVHLSRGDMDAALTACQAAERMARDIPGLESETKAVFLDSRIRLLLAQGKAPEAAGLVHENGLDVADEITYLDGFRHAPLARVLLHLGREQSDKKYLRDAQTLIARMLDAARAVKCMREMIDLLVLQALAFEAQGLHDRASVSLREALGLAEPETYVHTFIDEGEPMQTLLRQVLSGSQSTQYVRRLLAAFRQADVATGTGAALQPLIEPLSERELDVLRLLVTDLSGPEIAEQLTVSLNTMRTHTKNIYAKLGVNNRRAAVRQAKELGLI